MEEESHVKVLQGKNYEVLANHVFESVSDTKTCLLYTSAIRTVKGFMTDLRVKVTLCVG